LWCGSGRRTSLRESCAFNLTREADQTCSRHHPRKRVIQYSTGARA